MTTFPNTRTILWAMLGASGAVAFSACSVASTPATGWDCASVEVPNGSTIECTATNASALTASEPLPISYYCTPDMTTNPACPPADAGGTPTPPPSYTEDGGGGVTTGSGSVTGSGDVDAGSGDAGGDYGYDAGTPSNPGSGSGSVGSGGNPHGGPPGNGGNPHDDAGTVGTGGGSASGGGSDNGGGGSGGGGSDHGGGFTCDNPDGTPVCHKPPTCTPGTHPSACGACVSDGTSEDCTPPSEGGCWVTGGGFIVDGDGHDSFGGNAMPMKSGTIRGQWEHVDHGTGNKMHGEPSYIVCRHVNEPGPGADNGPHHDFTINQVYFGGTARFFTGGAWNDGYWFDVMAEDHGEGKGAKAGGPDYYHVTIRKMSGQSQSGTVVYDSEADMSGGNIQIHPPNNGHPSTASALPPWVSLQP
jgi:hypothetical protein